MSKLVTITAFLVTAAASVTACTDVSAQHDPGAAESQFDPSKVPPNKEAIALLPSDIKTKGTFTVAHDASYAPFEYFDTDNETIIGLDIDLTDALAAALGLDATHVNAGFDTILPGLSAGKYDAGASAFGVTPEREQVVDFVTYLEIGSGLAVQPGNPEDLTLDDPTSLCGHKITAQKGSIQGIDLLPKFSEDCVADGSEPITIQLYPSQNQANLALTSGRADGVMADSIPLSYEAEMSNGQFELAPGDDYDPVPLGIALPKDSSLQPALSAAMKSIARDGTLAEILQRWDVPESSMPAEAE